MPIYAYRCTTCGHAQDVLQKMSDPLLTTCPACSAGTYVKQVTAAGFQLKGSGWYVTDFRGGKTDSKPDGEPAKAGEKAAEPGAAKPADPPADKAAGTTQPAEKAATPAAPAPAAAAPAPSSGS